MQIGENSGSLHKIIFGGPRKAAENKRIFFGGYYWAAKNNRLIFDGHAKLQKVVDDGLIFGGLKPPKITNFRRLLPKLSLIHGESCVDMLKSSKIRYFQRFWYYFR